MKLNNFKKFVLENILHKHSHNYILSSRQDIVRGWVADLNSGYYAKAYEPHPDFRDIVTPVKLNFIPIVSKIEEKYICTTCNRTKTLILSDSDNSTYTQFQSKVPYDHKYLYEKNDLVENCRQVQIFNFQKFFREYQNPLPYTRTYDSESIPTRTILILDN